MTHTWPSLPAAMFAAVMFTGCLVVPGPDGDVYAGPPLPAVVEFEDEPYYAYGGYHYYYHDNAWYYSHARSGPWKPLPREHYPRETRFRHREHGEEHEHER